MSDHDDQLQARSGSTTGDYWVTVTEVTIVLLAISYVVSNSVVALLAWESVAALYLAVGFLVTRHASLTNPGRLGRQGFLDTLSWVLPLIASITGVTAAVTLLAANTDAGSLAGPHQLVVLAGAVGVILSWILLHAGFARVYEATQARQNGHGLRFSNSGAPDFGDFLYFAYGLGTFAHTDADVQTRRMRWIVLVHSVISFFYNAMVVAVAIEVLQRLVSAAD